MKKASHYSQLEGQLTNWLVPSNYEGVLSGAMCAQQDKSGDITLTYHDGEKETRSSQKDMSEFESFFAIVSYVQANRHQSI